MTKTDLRKKSRELIRKSAESMRQDLEGWLSHPTVDLSKFGPDYILPKLLTVALLEKCAEGWRPLEPDRRKVRL